MELLKKGKIATIVCSLTEYDGTPVTGGAGDIDVSMWKKAATQDGYWYSGTVWQSGYAAFNPFSEKSNGYYIWSFDTDGLIDSSNDEVLLFIRAVYSGAGSPTQKVFELCLTVGGLADAIETARKGVSNDKWIDSDNNQEVIFDDDSSELYRFDLKDINGDAANTAIYRRERV